MLPTILSPLCVYAPSDVAQNKLETSARGVVVFHRSDLIRPEASLFMRENYGGSDSSPDFINSHPFFESIRESTSGMNINASVDSDGLQWIRKQPVNKTRIRHRNWRTEIRMNATVGVR